MITAINEDKTERYIHNNYIPGDRSVWTGRIDDTSDRDAFRWHQVIELTDLNDADVPENVGSGFCFLGFCCDKGVELNLGRKGTARAPLFIRQELANLPVSFPSSVHLVDAGDLVFDEQGSLVDAQHALAVLVEKILDRNLFPILLGGGHEIALGHFNGLQAFMNHTGHNDDHIGIINFDAHFDLRPFDKGESSGSMFSRIAAELQAANKPFNYFCLGIQGYGNTVSLFKKADELKVRYIRAKDIDAATVPDILDQLNEFMDANQHIYLTLCFDVISSAFAPGVSATQPFGLHPEILLKLLKPILLRGKVRCFDVAEVSPRFDEDNRTAKLAAIIIYAVINTLYA